MEFFENNIESSELHPFIDLTKSVESTLEQTQLTREHLNSEILRGLTLNQSEMIRDPDFEQEYFFSLIDYKGTNPFQAAESLNDEDKEFLSKLDEKTASDFLFFHGANYMWDYILCLTENKNWLDRSSPSPFSKVAKKHFPKLIRFCESLPFEFIGRVMILGVHPNQEVYLHRDGEPGDKVIDCLLTSFQCPTLNKKFLIYDDQKKAHEAPMEGFAFDDAKMHRVLPSPHFTYTLRVDGKFKSSMSSMYK